MTAPATHRTRLTGRRLALVALALVVLPTAVVWRRAALHRGALQSWSSSSSIVLRLTSAAAQAWIRERTGDVHLLAGSAGNDPALFRIAVPGHPLMTDATLKATLSRAIEQLQHANGAQYTRIWIFDAQGAPVVSSSAHRPVPVISTLAKAALTTDSVLVTHVFGRWDGSLGMAFVQRVVYSGPGHPGGIPADGVLGSVVLVIDPRASLFPALEGGSIRANEETTTLLMAHGDSVFEYLLSAHAHRAVPTTRWPAIPSFERQALSGVQDTNAHVLAGEVVLARPVPGLSWAVLRRAQPSAVFAAADARLVGECAALVLVAGIATWLLLFRVRIIQARRSRELVASERRYRLIADNATDVIARFGADDRVRYVSPAIRWLLGYDPTDIEGRTLAELRHIADVSTLAEVVERARRHPGTSRIEHVVRDAQGNPVWVETLARSVDAEEQGRAGTAVGRREVVAVTRDISARKEAEAALRDAHEFVRAIVDSSPVAIIACDLEGRVLEWNRAAERLFGWTAAEIIGEPYPLAPGQLRDEMEHLRERTVLHGHLSDVPVRRQRKDGTLADVAISTGVIYAPGGTPTGVVVLATDLAERVRLETQLRQSQKMEAVGLLAGGIAHDFNNLLTVVTSYSSLLLRELPEGTPVRDDLVEIHAAAKRGAALVGQLLAFSRQQVLTPQPIDVNGLVAGMKQLLKRVLPGKITLQQVLCAESAVIEADPGQIEQVLLNLVVNARDAIGDAAGTITITTARERDERRGGDDDVDEELRDAVITVRDTGCGMPPHMLEQIFDPFFTTKERGQGTGLGLSTVQGIVAQSGGRVTVRSEEGRGTEFELRFPIVNRDPAVLSETPESVDGYRAPGTPTGIVLLVEDDARVRRVTARILEKAGYEVIAAADATEALAIYEEQAARIDVIVTDMMMPDLSGAELIARIRACGYEVPALFISGHTTPGPLAASAVDGSRFVQKPFTPEELTNKVRELVGRRLATSSTWVIPKRGQLTR